MASLGSDTKSLRRFERIIPEFGQFVRSRSSAIKVSEIKKTEVSVSLPAEEQSTIDHLAAAYDVDAEIVVMALIDWLGEMVEADLLLSGEDDAEARELDEVSEESLKVLLPQALESLQRANVIAEETVRESLASRQVINQAAREIDFQLTQLDRSLAELVDDHRS
jgi:hypothetical protein